MYVGRLSYDKSVDELLRAFEIAAGQQTERAPVLYLIGSGELLWLVREYEQRLPRQESRVFGMEIGSEQEDQR